DCRATPSRSFCTTIAATSPRRGKRLKSSFTLTIGSRESCSFRTIASPRSGCPVSSFCCPRPFPTARSRRAQSRSTEFIPFAPRRSHFWHDRDRMQERAKRNEFRSTTKIVARFWSLSENVLSGLGKNQGSETFSDSGLLSPLQNRARIGAGGHLGVARQPSAGETSRAWLPGLASCGQLLVREP